MIDPPSSASTARSWAACAPLLALFASCGRDSSAPGAEAALEFVDVAAAAGIDVVCRSGDPRRWYIVESNGCGAAWLDHDGDGDLDLFVANGCGLDYLDDGARLEVVRDASSRLYRNDGALSFTDVTDECGARVSAWTNAVTVADVEGDGDPDLYLAGFGRDVFLRNEGGRFVDATAEAGLGNERWGAGASFADADGDGDLDLYVANYVEFDCDAPPDGGKRAVFEGVELGWGPEEENGRGLNPGAPDVFYLGDGKGRFVEATAAAGLALAKPLCSYAAVFTDIDQDGDQDLLVANDLQPCNLFVNDGRGQFTDEADERGFAFDAGGRATAAMGLFVADVDRDGDFDVLRTNFDLEPNSLHVNDGDGRFRDRSEQAGFASASTDVLGWGGGFFDAELDGDLDLVVANGHVIPQAAEIGMHGWLQPTQLFVAEATESGDLPVWRERGAASGPGFAPLRSARGVALGDPDNDGDVDLLIVDLDEPPRLLENRSERAGHWLEVQLEGEGANRDGLGALVVVEAGGESWTRERRSANGLYSTHDPRLHFGLGEVPAVERVRVRWPDGSLQVVEDVHLDARFLVRKSGVARQSGEVRR